MRNPFRGQKAFWTAERRKSMYFAGFLLALAIAVQIVLGTYSSHASLDANSVRDIFLDNLPLVNLDFMIVGGYIILQVISWWLLAINAKRLIFGTKAIALYIVCRAAFTSMTHLGAYPIAAAPGPNNLGWSLYSHLTFQGNFFFSGHTGFPFMLALIFWDDKSWRWFFLAMAVIFGAAVLLAHEHYSIDVFAAPFIVYGVYRITQILFPRDAGLIDDTTLRR